jgi:hypothetical protein
MAAAAPTPAELQALILQLQTQVATLTSGAASAGPAPAAVVFADTPQLLFADDLIDYSTKQGSGIYEQGCKTLDDKALTDGFGMTSDQTVVFVESLTRRATTMGWNAGSKQITTFTNRSGKDVDIIKEYGQIDEVTLKTAGNVSARLVSRTRRIGPNKTTACCPFVWASHSRQRLKQGYSPTATNTPSMEWSMHL